MTAVIHFGMLVEINEILKEKKVGYSLHSIGGCSSCGVVLKECNPRISVQEVVKLINTYLEDKWLIAERDGDGLFLSVKSVFK
ncbi:MAG: hypothetical protein ACK5L6_02915 [Anaerorhabdus sp.]|uniref:RDAC family protein n=1 Tax=Anaerorhabdus sp. TaxID=1872524 RepID=UPI003A8582A4